jgi:hypothetical protein
MLKPTRSQELYRLATELIRNSRTVRDQPKTLTADDLEREAEKEFSVRPPKKKRPSHRSRWRAKVQRRGVSPQPSQVPAGRLLYRS